MSRTTRTFIAIAVPPPLGEKLTRLQARLAPDLTTVRWTTSLPFHATLAFLGDVPDPDLDAVCRAVAEAAAPFSPLELRLESLGCFPSPARPRVVWAGLAGDGLGPLDDLRKAVVRGVTRVGYRPEDDRFTPHVTLGRIKSDRRQPPPPDLTAVFQRYKAWTGGSFKVSEVTTFASRPLPEGPAYASMARARLAGDARSVP